MSRRRFSLMFLTLSLTVLLHHGETRAADEAKTLAQQIGTRRGICVLVGKVEPAVVAKLARDSELTLFVQSETDDDALALRRSADQLGMLGSRIYVQRGSADQIHLADNLADAVVVFGGKDAAKEAALRVVQPGGKLIVGESITVKPFPKDTDNWSHPYHGPDNNPQSTDKTIRAPYLTQFLAEPFYGPMPEVSVSAGGRMYKAFGHIAFKEREWPLNNTLIALNSYNGTELWRRKLHEGFMIHRNTMIATPELLLLADDQSCKLIDGATGKITDEIVPPNSVSKEKVWKWMALKNGVLYAMIGGPEKHAVVLRGMRTAAGWPWSGLGKGYAQKDYPWGFGHTLMAFDMETKKVLWSRTEKEPLDSRATCMSDGRLIYYSHGKYLTALNTKDGKPLWKVDDPKMLAAIGQHDKAQNPRLGYSTTSYIKCNDKAIYFAGPQRRNLVAVSAEDGSLLWQYPHGNYQLILRHDALYAMGRTATSRKFDLLSGKMLADLECFRGNCTRATATTDSIFTRGHPHTGTQRLVLDGDKSTRIGLMRPGCQDGVLVSNGLLYWGPWMCDCNLSLVGIIALGSAGDFQFNREATEGERLEAARSDTEKVAPFDTSSKDWTGYRAGGSRQSSSDANVGAKVKQLWQYKPAANSDSTAPVTAGGLSIVAGADGAVRAFDSATGAPRWTAYTGGEIRYSPSVWQGRVFVGSYDGWVYSFEAATGKLLWRFRCAPVERTISVYGKLSSTWPVAGGVVVGDGVAGKGVVYAAAGIASYDGTHIYALDAKTGTIVWQNNSSGRLVDEKLVSGVSVQGHLLLHDDKLYLAGGNVVSPAIFDAKTGKCLNTLDEEWVKAPRGRELFLVGNQVTAFDQLLYSPKKYQTGRYFANGFVQAQGGDVLVRGRPDQLVRIKADTVIAEKLVGLWQNQEYRQIAALAVTANVVLLTGETQPAGQAKTGKMVLAAINPKDGKTLWTQPLPAAPESWGLAVDRDGRTLVTLVDGRVLCFGDK